MNKKYKVIATGLLLSSPLAYATNDYSEFFAYDVSGVKVEDVSSPTAKQLDASAGTSGYQAEIIYLDEPTSTASSGYQPEIIYENQPVAAPARQTEIVYENTPVQQVPTAPGDSSYYMYADPNDSQQDDYIPATSQAAAVAPQAHQSQAKPVSSYEIEQVISTGRVDLAQALHARGADFLTPGHQGMTHLHKASAAGKLAMVKYLVSIGASPNASTEKNWTPLHHAARFGRIQVASYLLSVGASKHQKTSDGFNPSQLAINVQQTQLASLLK